MQSCCFQSPNHVRLFAIPWTAAHQASLSLTISRSLPKFISIALVMPSSHLILCCSLDSIFLYFYILESHPVKRLWACRSLDSSHRMQPDKKYSDNIILIQLCRYNPIKCKICFITNNVKHRKHPFYILNVHQNYEGYQFSKLKIS